MNKSKKRIKIIIEKTETGFSAFTEDYPIFTTGKTITELQNNALEATQLYFDEQEDKITIK
jgi:predicted RNase H-like HicB family nuclease